MDLYFHAREEDGSIKPVEDKPPPDTLDYHLMHVDLLVANKVLTPEDGQKAKEQVRIKWQQKKQSQK